MGSEKYGLVLTLNVGQIRQYEWEGRLVHTAIWKSPVAGRLAVRGVNVVGDDQADRTVHGGPDKAVYSYASEDEAWWEQQLGHPVVAGNFGENLTLSGVDVSNAVVGERWRIGTALLEVCQPRIPCYKLNLRMNDRHFGPVFSRANRPGAYLRIIEEGEVGAGDEIELVQRPAHGLTVSDVARIYHGDRDEVARMLEAPELAEGWVDWAENVLRHRKRG